VSSVSHRRFTHLGLDVSKDSIAVAVLAPDRDGATVQKIFHDEVSVRRLIGPFDDRSRLWACYEANPTGYDLYRLLLSMGARCDVIAPSLIPKRRGDHVKTDKRDARQLAGLHRAGQLTPIGVPSPAQEGVRDLCRTRGDMVEDLTRARNRLTKFLLRHSVLWRDGSNWTFKHQRWRAGVHFDDRALATTFAHYRATVELRDRTLAAVVVVEVDRPNRQERRRNGKSDQLDAIEAARAALSGRASGIAKSADGDVEAIRALLVVRRSGRNVRIKYLNQIRHLGFTAPDELRERLRDVRREHLAPTAAALRPTAGSDTVVYATKLAIESRFDADRPARPRRE
jgi:hypothetical protein